MKIWNYETEKNYGEWDEPGPADMCHIFLSYMLILALNSQISVFKFEYL